MFCEQLLYRVIKRDTNCISIKQLFSYFQAVYSFRIRARLTQ